MAHNPRYECTNPECPGKPYHPNGMTWNEVNEFNDPPTCMYLYPVTERKLCDFPVRYLGTWEEFFAEQKK